MLDRHIMVYRRVGDREVYVKSFKTVRQANNFINKQVEETGFIHYFRYRNRLPDIENKIRKFIDNEEIREKVVAKYKDIGNVDKLSGRRISSVVATITYIYLKGKYSITQEKVSDFFNVSVISLRNNKRLFYEDKELKEWLKT